MDENYLKLLLMTIVSTLILLLNKGLFNAEQQKEVDRIIVNLKGLLINLRES